MDATTFLDANVLVYAYVESDPRSERARELVGRDGQISVQVLGEFVAVARRKLRLSPAKIDAAVDSILASSPNPVTVDLRAFHDAMRIVERYGYHQFDAQIIAAALRTRASTLLSEDMQHGQVIDGRLVIRNPFRAN